MLEVDESSGEVRAAWRGLLDGLRDTDVAFLHGPRGEFDPYETAPGYRHLSGVMALATGS